MLLSKTTRDPRDWVAGIVRSRRVDAVIVIGQSLHHEHLNELADLDFNMVVWGAQLPDQRYATVGSDNHHAGHTGTLHLLEQGCRRLVFLGDCAVPEVGARRDGFLQALREAGISQHLEVAVRFGSDSAYEAVSSLLNAHAEFDGIFACSDVIAMSTMRALTERGRRVPADVAIVGFDDVPLAAYTTPPLTTIRQDWAAGARILVERALRPKSARTAAATVLPTELVIRASSLREHHQPGRHEQRPTNARAVRRLPNQPGSEPHRIRFEGFEADLRAEELFEGRRKLRLAQQSFRVLAVLLEKPGQLVTRQELRARLWPNGTLVEYDKGLNAAINRLREALGDSADAPRFIETLPNGATGSLRQSSPSSCPSHLPDRCTRATHGRRGRIPHGAATTSCWLGVRDSLSRCSPRRCCSWLLGRQQRARPLAGRSFHSRVCPDRRLRRRSLPMAARSLSGGTGARMQATSSICMSNPCSRSTCCG